MAARALDRIVALQFSIVLATNNFVLVNVTRGFHVHWVAANVALETLRVPPVQLAGNVDQMSRLGQRTFALDTKLYWRLDLLASQLVLI